MVCLSIARIVSHSPRLLQLRSRPMACRVLQSFTSALLLLHSLLGEYIRRLEAEGAIESQMTKRILKSSIANLEAFNSVRNERSFAHDNPLLNYEESLLIFNNVVSGIRFLQALERNQADEAEGDNDADFDEVPF